MRQDSEMMRLILGPVIWKAKLMDEFLGPFCLG